MNRASGNGGTALGARVAAAVEGLSVAAALAGGALLLAMALVTLTSVLGRAAVPLGAVPIRGDFELVEIGTALAVFAFLPWCQLRRGHVSVDILAATLPPRAFAALGLLGQSAMSLAAAVLLWRLWLGFGEKLPFGGDAARALLGWPPAPFYPETTYDLQLPLWVPYAAAVPLAALFLAACLLGAARSLIWTRAGAEPSPDADGSAAPGRRSGGGAPPAAGPG